MTETNVMTWPHRTCYEDRSKEQELSKCLSKQIKDNFQKRSPMAIIINGDNRKILSESDFNDEWEEKAWKRIETKCHEMTNHIKACNDVRVVTTVDERLSGQGTNLTLVELVPADQSFEYIHTPKMDIESFLQLIGAILSTGFGFSLFTWRGCRWKRYKKHGRCWYFGFRTDNEDPEARRVTQLEDGGQADKALIKQMRKTIEKLEADQKKTNHILKHFAGNFDPIRTEMKKLETGFDKLKKKNKKKVNRQDMDGILDEYFRQR